MVHFNKNIMVWSNYPHDRLIVDDLDNKIASMDSTNSKTKVM